MLIAVFLFTLGGGLPVAAWGSETSADHFQDTPIVFKHSLGKKNNVGKWGSSQSFNYKTFSFSQHLVDVFTAYWDANYNNAARLDNLGISGAVTGTPDTADLSQLIADYAPVHFIGGGGYYSYGSGGIVANPMNRSYTPWVTLDVINDAWKQGWTGDGVNIGIVELDPRQDLHPSIVEGIIKGYCSGTSLVAEGSRYHGNNDCTGAPSDYVVHPGIAPHANIVYAQDTDTTALVQTSGLSGINHSYGRYLYVVSSRRGYGQDIEDARASVAEVRTLTDAFAATGANNVFGAGNYGEHIERGSVYLHSVYSLEATGNVVIEDHGSGEIVPDNNFKDKNGDGVDDENSSNVKYTRDADNTAIVVGALVGHEWDASEKLANYSLKAGALKADYMVAYGAIGDALEGMLVGTSFAAPRVTGALALLADKFSDLNAQQRKFILLETANGLGQCKHTSKQTSCTDAVFGHGSLDVSSALSPIGTLK
ncbi:MAG: S8 family serine peptidase [Gammaproteobacteria bacterium]